MEDDATLCTGPEKVPSSGDSMSGDMNSMQEH